MVFLRRQDHSCLQPFLLALRRAALPDYVRRGRSCSPKQLQRSSLLMSRGRHVTHTILSILLADRAVVLPQPLPQVSARWHWAHRPAAPSFVRQLFVALLASSPLTVVSLQMGLFPMR